MLGDQPQHLTPYVVAVDAVDVETVEHPRGGWHAGSFVARRPPAAIDHGCGERLSEVVAHGTEHHGGQARPVEVGVPLPRFVDHHQRVDPHVALGMPLGILRAVVERHHLRQHLLDHAEVARQGESERRSLRHQQQLLDFAPEPFSGEVVERDGAADGARLVIQHAREACGELHGAQHPQAVVGEGARIDHAQPVGVEVGAAAERIEVLVGERIPADRVDREVAAPGGVLERHGRVALDRETGVSAPVLRLAAGQGHVDRAELVDGEGAAHRLHASEGAEQGRQVVLRHAEDLEVEVFRGPPAQPVAHVAAHHHRPAATRTRHARHGHGQIQRIGGWW